MQLEGELLKKLRMLFGFKQQEMAKSSGIYAPYLSRAERGIQALTDEQSEAILKTLCITEEDVEEIRIKFEDIIASSDKAK